MMQRATSKYLYIFAVCLTFIMTVALPDKSHAGKIGMLNTKSANRGSIEHTVTVESAGNFRLVFEAAFNYGISKWFDLVNDPAGERNLLHNVTSYPKIHAQPGLFNQRFDPGDMIAHIISAKQFHQGEEREIRILESNPVRVIVQCSCHPMVATKINRNIKITTLYVIYSTGKILITNTLLSLDDQVIEAWRNSIIGLGDPSFSTLSESGKNGIVKDGIFSDGSKMWSDDQWSGYRLDQQNYNAWEIISNTSNTLTLGSRISGTEPLREGSYSILSRHDKYGWLRSTDLQDPYKWHSEMARYFFAYWDPSTPEPYSSWTKASVLLVPQPKNPYQGRQFHHEWMGFKRFYYAIGKIPLKKGETITQRYMLQLGTRGSSLLPDISNRKAADRHAADYLDEHKLTFSKGMLVNDGFDTAEGCYSLASERNEIQFTVDRASVLIKPALKVHGYRSGDFPRLLVNGEPQKPGRDYTCHMLDTETLLVQFLFDIRSGERIDITPDPLTNSMRTTSEPHSQQIETEPDPQAPVSSIAKQGQRGLAKPRSRNYAILTYSRYPSKIAEWIDERFSYKISGAKPSGNVKWMTYIDVYGIGSLVQYLEMKDFAGTYGLEYEEMLLHARKNYTSKVRDAFREMDKFDVFEGKNGILKTKNHKVFEDLTDKAYNGEVKLTDTVYIGYEEPFAEVRLQFSSPGKRVDFKIEYWNGTLWQNLSVKDETAGFTRKGTISFIPPADWGILSVNNSRRKYFIRIAFSSADTYPTTSRIYGDDWLNGAGNACRGWDDSNPAIVNTGPLAYNPIPPADASAKFRYQARIAFWADNHFVANPADVQVIGDRKYRTWAKFLAEQVVKKVLESGYAGVMCDDGEGNVVAEGISPDKTDFVRKTKDSWLNENLARYEAVVGYIKEANPQVAVGINSQRKRLVTRGDWNLAEFHTAVWHTASHRLIAREDSGEIMTYDDYLPEHNKKGLKGILIYQDTTDVVPGTAINWDRGHRGPIAALSKHYIGMNENTIFSYYSRGGYIYDETDQVYLYNDVVLHQAVDKIPKIQQVKRWGTYFPAMGVDVGKPDPKGFNQGRRDFQWKKGKNIGGGPDIWRRDFTNAVVLHRPALYNTPKEQYDTYSPEIPVGGRYYPLKADGCTTTPVARVMLRAGEGAILLKEPIECD